jgi:hypothetical protein
MAQSAASDPWKQARDAAKRDTSASNLAGDDDEVPPPTTAVDTGEDGANAVEVPAVASTDLLAGANAASGNDGLVDEDMDAAAADAAADGCVTHLGLCGHHKQLSLDACAVHALAVSYAVLQHAACHCASLPSLACAPAAARRLKPQCWPRWQHLA